MAPVVAAVLWMFLFNPGLGLFSHLLNQLGYNWNYAQNSGQAMFLIVLASIWQQMSYNFLFSLPRCSPFLNRWWKPRRLTVPDRCAVFNLSLPLITPVSFFLLVVNLVYAFSTPSR